MPDRRRNKLKLMWNNSIGGKILITLFIGVLLTLLGSVISMPIVYETKANSRLQIDKAESRTCAKIVRLEKLHEKEIERNRIMIESVNNQLITNSNMLQRIDERTILMYKKLK